MSLPYKIGSNGAEITAWQQWFGRYAKSYAPPVDGYYGNGDRDATRILQAKLGVPVTGEYDAVTAAKTGFPKGLPAREYRPIWIYTAPGSGAPWNVGPSFDLGNRAQDVLHINHQPIGYPIGGYLGLMGGDPTYSYNDVIGFEGTELERLLSINPDVIEALRLRQSSPNAAVPLELWFSGYSQSADGLEDALVRLFGDGGRFAVLRDRINGVIQFGNPSTRGTGIARKVRPEWLYGLVHNVNYDNDFYAVATDAIRPAFYAIIIQAEMALPFGVHLLRIAVPIIMKWAATLMPIFGPLLGGFGPMVQLALGTIQGLQGLGNNPALGSLFGQAGTNTDAAVDQTLIDMLSPTGILEDIPGLIQLVGALPGLQAHGGYQFDAVMMQRAYDVLAGFHR